MGIITGFQGLTKWTYEVKRASKYLSAAAWSRILRALKWGTLR